MVESLRILVLNNACGPLIGIARELINLGHVLEFIEADPNSSRDLEQTKAQITAFNPDFVLQQNFNVYMLTGDFGVNLADWMETTSIKQVFWMVARPDSVGRPFLLQKWLQLGYFKNSLFLCTSKAMDEIFSNTQATVDHLPVAIESSIAVPIEPQQTASAVSFFSTSPSTLKPSLSVTLNTPDGALRYVLSVLLSMMPSVDQQQLVKHILHPIRDFLTDIALDYTEFVRKKQRLKSKLRFTPEAVTAVVLNQLDQLYSNYVSFGVYCHIKPQLVRASGSPFWDAINAGKTEILGPSACHLDSPSFEPGLVVSFSNYITMDAPSAAPLAVIATGNMSLSEYREELPLLIPQEYLLTYRTLDELTDNINRYQQNPGAFTEQKIAAQEHILRHHTYEVRAQQLVDKVNSWQTMTSNSFLHSHFADVKLAGDSP